MHVIAVVIFNFDGTNMKPPIHHPIRIRRFSVDPKQPAATSKQNLLGLMISSPQGHYYLINSPLERNTQPKGNQVTDIDFQPVNKV